MIRWCIGFFLVLGSVGGLEQDTMTISQALAFALWVSYSLGGRLDFNKQYGEDV